MVTQTLQKGYKQTEVGVIPKDWNVKKLNEIFSITAGGDLKKELFSEIKDEKHPYPIYSNSLLNKGLYGYSSDYEYNENCVTITGRGALGVANSRDHKFNAIIRVLILKPLQKMSCFFISEYLNNKVKFSIESTGVPQLTAPQVSGYKVAFPNPEEQTKIAQVLSDTDKLIESFDKLIVKKKNLKVGSMQELLTGKKRLSGFKEEWEVKKLKEIAEIIKGSGLSKTKIIPDGKYKCILYGELFTTYSRVIKKVFNRTNYKEGTFSKKGDVLMPGSTTTIGIDLAIASALLEDKVLLGGDINIIRPKNNLCNSEFLADYLTYVKKNKIAEIAQGITIIHLYGKNLKELSLNIPKDPEEQQAIAQVLSDMDAEIEELEQKRDKVKLLKDGMMQQLLIGRIRLK